MRTLAAILLAATLLAPAASAAPATERLVMKPYPGGPWKRITDKSNARGWIHEQIPAGQSVDTFSDILTDQGYATMAGGDPSEFLKARFANIQPACEGMRVNGPTPRMEGGLKVAYAQVYCGRQAGQSFGVSIFYKAIGGGAALYSVSREFHTPPSSVGGVLSFAKGHEAEAGALVRAQSAADSYLLKDVYVCGGKSDDPRCRR